MAKKNSAGGGVALVGLILLGMVLKYWEAFLSIGIVVLVIWGIVKLLKGSSGTKPVVSEWKSYSFDAQKRKVASPNPALKIEVTTNYSRPQESSYEQYDSAIYGASAQSVPPDSVWIPQGQTVSIQGYPISGGLIYSGTGLKNFRGWGPEPALIDPTLPIDRNNPDKEGTNMSYWPSYCQIQPSSRAAFLEWLSTGRKDPNACIGYVFIYFYGLERRVLADAKNFASARAETDIILAEAKRLLSIYGKNGSFSGYCSRFIDVIQSSAVKERLYDKSPDYSLPSYNYEIPLSVKIGLGQMAADGKPLPGEWALAWVLTDPMTPRRTPVHRCREEFGKLFCLKYAEKFGDGAKLKQNKTKIKYFYRPASASFGGQLEVPLDGLSDVTVLKEPISTLRLIVDACSNELDAYSRYLGRKTSGRDSIEGVILLPQELRERHGGKEYKNLSTWLQTQGIAEQPVVIDFSELLQLVPSISGNSFGKREATALAQVLASMGTGIEPDARFGNFLPKSGQEVVLFKLSDQAPLTPSSEYSVATILLHLASAVAHADGSVASEEKRHLEEHLETWLHLSPDERTRLKAHTQWLLQSFPGMNGIKKRLESLNQQQKESIGRFLVGVAQADGYIAPTEIKMLTKIYDLLGLDSQSLYSHAHAAAVEPVTVQVADIVKPTFTIPTPPQQTASQGVSLDMGAVEAKMAETIAVSALLKDIFTDDESAQVASTESEHDTVTIAGLDPESFSFMQILASKFTWAREELEKLALDHNLMLDGTLDSINDASFDYFGGPFFEGEDPIEINADYAKEIAV